MSQGKNKAVENFWRGGALSGYSRAGGQLSGPTEVVLFRLNTKRMWKLQGFGLGFWRDRAGFLLKTSEGGVWNCPPFEMREGWATRRE